MSTQIFRTWLALGLTANLAISLNQGSMPASPLVLWLVLIPLSAYTLLALPEFSARLSAQVKRSWRHRHGAQAVRVKRMHG